MGPQQKVWSPASSSARLLGASARSSKACVTCPYGMRKTLSHVNRKAHPALLERELQEPLTHSFHYSAGFFMYSCSMRFSSDLFSWEGTDAKDGKVNTEQCGQAHLPQMGCWVTSYPSMLNGHCQTLARSTGQEMACSSFATLVFPFITKGGLNLSQRSTYHSLFFLQGNHRKIYLSKERGSKDFNSLLLQLVSGLFPYVATRWSKPP